ncbi:MAG: nitroreductase family deazaflavin-dependent oxidoreductase [Chloroflexota bacterium]|nr:nitroreductase family deazaflavin-dependent oxidoreductase [Chloroflexota bacterium]
MPNPWAGSKFYAKLGNTFTRPLWSVLPAPSGFGILTTIGRRSGKPRRHSVRAIRQGDIVFVVAMMGEKASWLKNIRADPEVTLRLGKETFNGTAQEANDSPVRQRAMDAYTGTVTLGDYFDYIAYHWGFPTRSKIVRAHRHWFEDGVPLIIQLEPSKEATKQPNTRA